MIHFTHFQTVPKIPKKCQKSSNLGTKSLKAKADHWSDQYSYLPRFDIFRMASDVLCCFYCRFSSNCQNTRSCRSHFFRLRLHPVPKYLTDSRSDPDREFFQIWESEFCSDSSYHRSNWEFTHVFTNKEVNMQTPATAEIEKWLLSSVKRNFWLAKFLTSHQRWARIRTGSDWIRTEANFGRIRTGWEYYFFEIWRISDEFVLRSQHETFLCFGI